MVLAIPTLRYFLIVSFLSLGLILKGQGKVEADFAESDFLLRLTVSQETGSRIRLILEPVIANSFKLDTAKQFVIGWKEDVFKTALLRMHKDVWKNYKNDSLPDAFKLLDSQLQRSYSYFYLAFQEKKFEELSTVGYGLTSEDRQLYKDYLQALVDLQDTIRFTKKAVRQPEIDSSVSSSAKSTGRKRINQKLKGIQDSIQLSNQLLREINQKIGGSTITKLLPENTRIPSIPQVDKFTEKLISSPKDSLSKNINKLEFREAVLKSYLGRLDNRRQNLLYLIGDANVVSSFKNANANQVNAGFGLLAVKPGYSEFFGVITVAQAQEDSTSEYGPSVLVPGVRRFSLLTSFRQYSLFRYNRSAFLRRIGIGGDVNITPYRWVNDSVSVKAIPFAVNLLLPYYFVHQSKPGEDYAISFDIGMSVRYIGGDLSKKDIKQFLGEGGRRWYVGPIAGINIKYNALRAQFHAPLFFVKDKNRIPGLTNGQVFASIGILANLTGDLGKVFKVKN